MAVGGAGRCASVAHDAGGERGAVGRMDDEERAPVPARAVGLERKVCGQAQARTADVVGLQRLRRFVHEGIEVVARLALGDDRLHRGRAVLDEHTRARGGRPGVELEELDVDLTTAGGECALGDHERAARGVEVVGELE
jgi:hypothetical protein